MNHLKGILVFSFVFFFMFSPKVFSSRSRSYIELNSGYIKETFKSGHESDLAYAGTSVGHISGSYFFNVNIPYYYLSGSNQDSDESGIGDINLGLGKIMYQSDKGVFINLSTAIKLPTADKKKGLGTGSTDYTGYLNLGKNIGRYSLYLYGGYFFSGNDDNNNITSYGLNISKFLKKLILSASLEYRTPIASGYSNEMLFRSDFVYNLNQKYSLKAGSLFGSDGDNSYKGINLGIVTFF